MDREVQVAAEGVIGLVVTVLALGLGSFALLSCIMTRGQRH
jgi:hypothetical protein